MTALGGHLSSLQQHASTLEQSLAAVDAAVDDNMNGKKQSGPAAQSPKGKPGRGVSKSKRAALVLDAMKPVLASALEKVCTADNKCCIQACCLCSCGLAACTVITFQRW